MAESVKKRWISIDALRGLAVIFMLSQHMIYWLCSEVHSSLVVQALGAMGGLAAPLFILIAGIGVEMAARRHENISRLLPARGIMIMGLGYLLNLLAPTWFSPGSWYILHMIGFAMITAPLLRKAPGGVLMIFLIAVLACTVILQNSLNTPLYLQNWHMASTGLSGGVLRLALVEGFFPVFPWIGFFLAGILAGRIILDKKNSQLWIYGCFFISVWFLLSAVYFSGFEFTRHTPWIRIFKPLANFYPALTPVTLLLMGSAILLLAGFLWLQSFREPGWIKKLKNFLAHPGRCSLTILIVHIPLVREPVVRFGWWRTLPAAETLALTLGMIVIFSVIAVCWGRIQYKYGAEWALRKVFP
jgi:surface polysaccharide O-acyltransferase-like enzyme